MRENLLRYVQSESGDHYDLYLMLLLNRSEQYHEIFTFRRLIFILYLLLIPVLLLIVLFVRRRITRPIGLLADASGWSQRIEKIRTGLIANFPDSAGVSAKEAYTVTSLSGMVKV